MAQKFANAARAALAADISDVSTTITIGTGGSLFPVANGTDWFKAVLQDVNGIEIVYVTAHTAGSTSFTVTRGQDGTTARAFATGSIFGIRVVASDMDVPANISSTQVSNWNTAYGWGNHASAGYLLSATAASTYQPLDADLTSIADLAGTAGLLKKTAANTWSLDTSAYLTGNQSISITGDASGSGTTSISLTLATVPLSKGGTGQTTKTEAFDALAPTTTKGDLIVSNGTDNVRLAVGTNDYVLTADSTAAAGVKWAASAASPEVKTPTNVSPAGGATSIGETPALTGSTYYSLYGVAMAAGQWQVSTSSDFSSTVVNTGDVAGTSVTYNVSAGVLSTNTTHYWRVRYKDSNGVYSAWSTGTSFTTAASFGPAIGDAYGGGYYAGKIVQGGTTYYLVVAPKSSGENSSKQWKTSADAGPTATQTLNNGPAASASMNSATYPAAQFCEGLTIGGYSDWYLPSRDELELCYRNLKPTTTANNTSARPKSSYTYPEGNDVSGDTMGINRNSSPTGAAYTSGNPAQTSVSAFQTGNSEAFATYVYWSSSEYSATYAWIQSFVNGYQDYGVKNDSFYVRAVRRVAV